MQVPYGEGVAIHIGPEPCADACEGASEASAGECHLGHGAVIGREGLWLTVFSDSDRLEFFADAVRQIGGHSRVSGDLAIAPMRPLGMLKKFVFDGPLIRDSEEPKCA